jgi:hypothetical protein
MSSFFKPNLTPYNRFEPTAKASVASWKFALTNITRTFTIGLHIRNRSKKLDFSWRDEKGEMPNEFKA